MRKWSDAAGTLSLTDEFQKPSPLNMQMANPKATPCMQQVFSNNWPPSGEKLEKAHKLLSSERR
jgi:hypothetical protein